MRVSLKVLLALLLLLAAPAGADDAAERTAVAEVIESSIGWFADKDFDRLYSCLSDDADFFIFHPDSGSTIRGAAAFREFSRIFADTSLSYAGHEIHDLKIDLSPRRDAAWWSARLEDCSARGGRKSCWHDCRWTGVAKKQDGRWVIAQMHFSFAAEAVAAGAVERRLARELGDYTEMRALVGELFAAEKYAEAAAVLAGAVARYPDHVLANTFNLATMYARLDDRAEAVRALEEGHRRDVFYAPWSLEEATWDSLRTRPDFQRLLARNEELRLRKQSRSAMKLEVVTPEGYDPARAYPLFIALHGGGENIAMLKPHWTSPRLRREFVVAFVQSSQVATMDGYGWEDEATTRREIAEAYRQVRAAHRIDPGRVIVGGFSSGGFGSLVTAFTEAVPAAGFVVLCPEVPDDPSPEALAAACRRGLRGTLLTTERDPRVDQQRRYAERLAAEGLAVRFHVSPDVGHWYPDDLARLIDKGIAHIGGESGDGETGSGASAALADPTIIARVPISVVREKTIVPVRFEGVRELHLILDTGMGYDGVLLFKPSLRDSLGGQRFMEAQIPGAGAGPPSRAIFADSLSFRVGEADIRNQRVIILADDALASPEIDGVIGWSLLGHHAVEIDFDASVLTLRDAASFEPGPDWTSLPLTLGRNNLPYLDVSVAVADEPPVVLRAYVDCASSEVIELLVRPGMKFTVPVGATDVVLGRGLSGEIHGQRARIASLGLGPHVLREVQAAFAPAEVRSKAGDADAVLANAALRRFDLVYDYLHGRLLIRPNRDFGVPGE